MKKIPTLYVRDWDNNPKYVTDHINPECDWVFDPNIPSKATYKWDGTAVLIKGGIMYARHTLRRGKPEPEGWIPATDEDPNTGKTEGWKLVTDDPEFRYHRLAYTGWVPDSTYELIGPKVQGNPHDLRTVRLEPHGTEIRTIPTLTPKALRAYFKVAKDNDPGFEGIVWHALDGSGRMAKLKARDLR